jgi:hypothetical protein
MRRFSILLASFAALVSAQSAPAQISLTIANSSFETGAATQVPTGWTVASGQNPFWIGSSQVGAANPANAYQGSNFISSSWEIAGLPNSSSLIGGAANTELIYQDIDLTPHAAQISQGNLLLGLSYAFHSTDGNDVGSVRYDFYNPANSLLGGFNAQTTTAGGWQIVNNLSAAPVPAAASRLRISLGAGLTPTGAGSARNIAFDAIGASLQPPPPPELPSGIVHANLIQFDGDGAWTWYSDERAIVDPNNGHLLVNSVGFSPTVSGSPADVDVVNFNPTTGRRVRTQLSNLQPGNPNIQNDDHNNGALLVLPDGRYLAMYANHGNNGGLGDEFSRWRVSTNPGDTTSWSAEQLFNWYNNVPGANSLPVPNPDAANVSYHNLFYLSEEDQVYNISRSYGRLSTNGASQNMPNIMRYNPDTNTVQWAGQLLESSAQGYSAYPKYVSNGVDRIYFTTTETHPRNYNNSIYAGYIENGQTFDLLGNLIDSDIFDNSTVAGGSGFVPDVTDFTVVQQADPLGQGHNRLWTVDAGLDSGGKPMALYISRWNPDGATSDGSTTNPIDHRLHFAHWNANTNQWDKNEIAKMGNRLYRLPSDMSEQDYTGNAALVPGDPSTVYISTPYDPRDATGQTFTTSYEIYKGRTADGGQSWSWTAITENSILDNLRPIVPDSHGGDTTVLWFRGTYTTAHNINASIVGIVERTGESQSLVNYVDATSANTMYANGAALQTSTPSANAGPTDSLWHQRTGVGNGGSVLTSSESAVENAPMLKTTISGLQDGTYDIFAYFWSDNDEDWRLMAGLENNNLVDFRRYGAQHAEADQFISVDTVAANGNDLLLYRAYLGRTSVAGGSSVTAFIDDWQTTSGSAIRTWYDGLGYSLVTPVTTIPGDFDGNGLVNAFDLAQWKDDFGVNGHSDADGDGDTDGHDFLIWQRNLGAGALSGAANAAVPEPAACLLLLAALSRLPRRRPRK